VSQYLPCFNIGHLLRIHKGRGKEVTNFLATCFQADDICLISERGESVKIAENSRDVDRGGRRGLLDRFLYGALGFCGVLKEIGYDGA